MHGAPLCFMHVELRCRQCRLGVRQCYLAVLLRIFRNRRCYRIVEATIADVKFFGRDRHSLLSRQLGDGLANITVITNDLFNCEPLLKQIAPVQCRHRYDVGIQSIIGLARSYDSSSKTQRLLDSQCLDDLIQKDRYSMRQLRAWKLGLGPARHHISTAIN